MSGKLLLSGPSDTAGLKALIDRLKARGVGTTIVDGALSRLSLASPAVTEAMILATGAAVRGNIPKLVRKTKYVYELIGIEEIEDALRTRLDPLTQGVWAVSGGGEPIDLELPSVLMLERSGENLFRHGRRITPPASSPDKLFQLLRTQQREVELIVRDFTRVFASPEAFCLPAPGTPDQGGAPQPAAGRHGQSDGSVGAGTRLPTVVRSDAGGVANTGLRRKENARIETNTATHEQNQGS